MMRITSAEVESLLRLSVQTARAGSLQQARAVLRALSHQAPEHPHVWLCLARYAESKQEEREALEHLLRLRPGHPMARRLQRLTPSATPEPPISQPHPHSAAYPPPPPPMLPAAVSPQRRHLLLLAAGGLLLAVLLALAGIGTGILAPRPTAEPLAEGGATTRDHAYNGTAGSAAAATPTPLPPPPPTPTLPPRPTPTLLPMGYPLENERWTITLFQASHTHVFTTGVGTFEPEGRLLLILAAVGNNDAEPRHIPPALLRVTDAQGRSYPPAPHISSAYLDLYGRGDHGNLAFEEAIPAGGHLYNIPLFFDVSPDATDLLLTMVESPTSGWRVTE